MKITSGSSVCDVKELNVFGVLLIEVSILRTSFGLSTEWKKLGSERA